MDVASQLSTPTFDIGLAPRSPSNFYVDLGGEVRGVFVSTYDFHQHAIGTQVRLQLHLPDGRELSVEGTVEWQRLDSYEGPGYGVRFSGELPEHDHERVVRFMELREPLFYV
ncbi:MAG: hypothetical protein AB8H86_15460 [Polyangiales bacterium]